MDECIRAEYLQDPDYNVNINLNFKIKNVNSMKIAKHGVLNRFCKFRYLDQHASIKKS